MTASNDRTARNARGVTSDASRLDLAETRLSSAPEASGERPPSSRRPSRGRRRGPTRTPKRRRRSSPTPRPSRRAKRRTSRKSRPRVSRALQNAREPARPAGEPRRRRTAFADGPGPGGVGGAERAGGFRDVRGPDARTLDAFARDAFGDDVSLRSASDERVTLRSERENRPSRTVGTRRPRRRRRIPRLPARAGPPSHRPSPTSNIARRAPPSRPPFATRTPPG